MALSLIAEREANGGRILIYKETASDPASTGAVAVATVNITVPGITTADKVINATIQGLPSSAGVVLSAAFCQGANNVRLHYSNPSAGTVDLAAHEVIFEVLKVS